MPEEPMVGLLQSLHSTRADTPVVPYYELRHVLYAPHLLSIL